MTYNPMLPKILRRINKVLKVKPGEAALLASAAAKAIIEKSLPSSEAAIYVIIEKLIIDDPDKAIRAINKALKIMI